MLTILAAAAAAIQPVAASPSNDPDLRCMAAYLVAAGAMGDDPSASEEDKAGAQSIIMYFFGKLYARMPAYDVKGEIMRLVESPGYPENVLGRDLERCSAEAKERGRYLESFGNEEKLQPAQ